MKKTFLTISAVAAVLFAMSCGNHTEGDKVTTTEAQQTAAATGTQVVVDTAASTIGWRATHKGGLNPRFGTLKVQEGSFAVDNGQVTGGSFTVNIHSLYVDPKSVTEADKKPEDLVAHLLSPDFFDAEKYPDIRFDITKVEAFDSTQQKSLLPGATNLVSGNLTIKGKSVNVTFPARITTEGNKTTVNAKFNFDRSAWGLNYKADGAPENWIISKEVELTLDISGSTK